LRLSIARVDSGGEPAGAITVAYDLERGVAASGRAVVAGPSVVWRLDPDDADVDGSLLARTVELDRSMSWILRCDRIDFPLGGIAHRHVHPGPGIRYLLAGEILIETGGRSTTYGAGEAWFESGPEPVVARSSDMNQTSFVRLLLLPAEWAGKRTIRYLEPVDDTGPKQSATVLLEHAITPPG
jgi:hypothetical protein